MCLTLKTKVRHAGYRHIEMAHALHDVSWPARIRSLARFTAVAGTGWLLDFGVLYVLVQFAHLSAFIANVVSATTAGVAVFLVSRKVVFRGEEDAVLFRTLIYFVYTVGVIVFVSTLLSYVAGARATSPVTCTSGFRARPVS